MHVAEGLKLRRHIHIYEWLDVYAVEDSMNNNLTVKNLDVYTSAH